MIVQVPWPFNRPIGFVFFLKTAGIANEIVNLSVYVLAPRDSVNFAAVHPRHSFAGTGRTVAVCVHWIEEPNAAFEAKRAVCECTHGAHINDVAAEIIVNRFLDIGADLCVIAAVDDAVYTLLGELIGDVHTTETHDAARHVQFDIRSNVYFLEGAAFKFVTGGGFSMLKSQVL